MEDDSAQSSFTVGIMKAKDHDAQQQILEGLKKIAAYSKSSEAGVLKYAICVPRKGEPGHETDVVLIEEYADEDAYRAHMFSAPVRDLFTLFKGPPGEGEPIVVPKSSAFHHFEAAATFTRPNLASVKEPVVIQAAFGYQPGTTTDALDGWKPLVEYAEKEEPGTLFYAVLNDTEKSFIRTAELYENQAAIDKHLAGPGIADNQRQNGEWRTGERQVFRCTVVGGFWAK